MPAIRLLAARRGLSGRTLAAATLAAVAVAFVSAAVPAGVLAQEAPADGAADVDLGALDEVAAEPAAPAPAAAEGAGGEGEVKPQNALAYYFGALGIFYTVVFLALSFTLVALIVMNLLTLQRSNIVPADLVETFEEHLNQKRYQEAYDLAKNDDSFLGHVLSAGLAKLQSGYPQAIEAMQEVGEEETMKIEHRLSYVALIGTVSPMVGLLGTVQGMVASFQTIATSPTQPKPSDLAQGISMALVTTLVGLFIAIPAIGLFGILKNRMARMVLEVGILSEGLMSRFSNVPTKKA